MFDPIKGPPDPYSGPSTGDSTEKGDSWHAAVAKINGMFERLFHGGEDVAESVVQKVESIGRPEFEALKADLEAVKAKLDGFFVSRTYAAPAPPPDHPPPTPETPAVA